jgi:hypothetical protein
MVTLQAARRRARAMGSVADLVAIFRLILTDQPSY